MKEIKNQVFDEERALYGEEDAVIRGCTFDGPADGESALKECSGIRVEDSTFRLRYPFWHDRGLEIDRCTLTEGCRAALWYSQGIRVTSSTLGGIKALRECHGASISHSTITSPEFGWRSHDVSMEDVRAQGEYFMFESTGLRFKDVDFSGKYSFQYIRDAVFEDCAFDTKDAFWHAEDVVVRNCTVRGEYLAWYSRNVRFERCRIIGTQPLCYCDGLQLVDCVMEDTDLAFERSHVEASLLTSPVSIKNPLTGSHISIPAPTEVIRDIPGAEGIVEVKALKDECA